MSLNGDEITYTLSPYITSPIFHNDNTIEIAKIEDLDSAWDQYVKLFNIHYTNCGVDDDIPNIMDILNQQTSAQVAPMSIDEIENENENDALNDALSDALSELL